MENASKALIMAGIIIIGILLIALMVYFFNSAHVLKKSYDDNISTTRIVEFNTQFTKYNISSDQYNQSKGKDYVTIYNIITLANLASEFNTKENLKTGDSAYIRIDIYDTNGASKLIVDGKILGTAVETNASSTNNELLKNYNQRKFYTKSVSYDNSTGRVKGMEFVLLEKK